MDNLNLPDNPTVGQVYEKWTWDGTVWALTPAVADEGGGMPVGAIVDYIGTTAPTDWIAMTGGSVANAQTLYPDLWAVLPANLKSGSSLLTPDTRGRVSVGYSSADARFNVMGGAGYTASYDAVVPTHEHYVGNHTHNMKSHSHVVGDHTHGVSHNHTAGTDSQGDHNHGWGHGSMFYYNNSGVTQAVGGGGYPLAEAQWLQQGNHGHNITVNTNYFNASYMVATHGGNIWTGYPNDNQCDYMVATHGGNVATTANTTQTAVTDRNIQPYVTFLKILKVA